MPEGTLSVAALVASGHVEEFQPPNYFVGWAGLKNETVSDDAYVAVLRDGAEIGRAKRTISRQDVPGYGVGPVGFHVETTNDVTFKDMRDDRIRVLLRTTRGDVPLHLERQLDTARVVEAVNDLILATSWNGDRLHRMLRALHFNKSVSPQTTNQVTACLELLHPERGLSDVQALSERVQRLDHISNRAAVDVNALEMLQKFDGIGENCEFGFLQRHFGYEPIRLLRWSRTPLVNLIEALSTGFDGVGTAAQTELLPMWDGEYGTRDKRFDLTAHTFIRTAEVRDFTKEFVRQCQRISYLRRLLMDSLSNDTHVFVYYTYEGLDDYDCRQLFRALRRYGPNRLLCVRANPLRQGTVTLLEDGLAVGYLDRFSKKEAVAKHISYRAWMAVLKSACSVFGI